MYLIAATCITGMLHTLFITVLYRRMPISYYLVGSTLQFIFMTGVRFSYRFMLIFRSKKITSQNGNHVMVIGAGNAGQAIIRDIKGAKEIDDWVSCVIDDDPNKWGAILRALRSSVEETLFWKMWISTK